MIARRCAHCDGPMPRNKRSHAITCSKPCRQARARASKHCELVVRADVQRIVMSRAARSRAVDLLSSGSAPERVPLAAVNGERRFVAFVTIGVPTK